MAQPRLKFWGWGYEGEALAPDEIRWLEGMWAQQFRVRQFDLTPPPTADASSRGRARPSPLVRPGAPRTLCLGAEIGEKRARSQVAAQSGCTD